MLGEHLKKQDEDRKRSSPVIERVGLIAGMAHDLNLIGGIADAAAEGCPEWDPRRQELDRIRSEVAALYSYLAEAMI